MAVPVMVATLFLLFTLLEFTIKRLNVIEPLTVSAMITVTDERCCRGFPRFNH